MTIMETIAKCTLLIFGSFFIVAGFIMLVKPSVARSTLRKAGSTALINYTELSVRMIPAIAFVIYADFSAYPSAFKFIGWYILITSIILMSIPRKLHHQLSNRFADFLSTGRFQLISPVSIFIGVFLIYIIV
jgi:hypothetical protein